MLRTLLVVACLGVSLALPIPQPNAGGKQWALLVAGSKGWDNYRHQADVYHAYQILHRGGIPDEQIVVMHYDDIAHNLENPHKGTIINSPNGSDVYKGVPKDYVGHDANPTNFYAALKGDASATNGGSGKVIASGPDDTVFVYFADHGGPGLICMPAGSLFRHNLYAKDINAALEAKAKANGFKQLVFYIEACESGSIFEDKQLPDNINIYATTAANGQESSWGCYCPGMPAPPPKGYGTCLGDLYSVSWMEDTDLHSTSTETLETQYTRIKQRVSQNGTYTQGSHVQQFGELSLDADDLSVFIGASGPTNAVEVTGPVGAVPNRDASLVYYNAKIAEAKDETERLEAEARLAGVMAERRRIDGAFASIASRLSSSGGNVFAQLSSAPRSPVVNDWECYADALANMEQYCAIGQYGVKHGRVLADLCDSGVKASWIGDVAKRICQ